MKRHEWRLLIDAEAASWAALSYPAEPKALQACFTLLGQVLDAYRRSLTEREPLDPAPEVALIRSARIFAEIGAGSMPEPVAHSIAPGRARPGALELQDIHWAVAYRMACEPSGFTWRGVTLRIHDPHPVKTLQAWFGVGASTVAGWRRKHQRPQLPSGPLIRDCADEDEPIGVRDFDPDAFLERRTRMAGARYRLAGRSVDALVARDALGRSES